MHKLYCKLITTLSTSTEQLIELNDFIVNGQFSIIPFLILSHYDFSDTYVELFYRNYINFKKHTYTYISYNIIELNQYLFSEDTLKLLKQEYQALSQTYKSAIVQHYQSTQKNL